MSKFTCIEDINAWQEGITMAESIYMLIRKSKPFASDFGFKDQLQRAAVSIPSNIAEGFERQTNPEFIRFLYIAKGSCGEVRTQLYLALKLNYLAQDDFIKLDLTARKISGMIMNLIKTLK